jgi:hypothetical protein
VTVECSNCGVGAELWVALASLVVAVASVIVALRAARDSKRSADATDRAVALAHDEVEMARKEHDEFLRGLRARARFRLSLRSRPEPEDGVISVDASTVQVRVEIGLKNEGDRAAGETVLNVVAPRHVLDFRWCGPQGEAVPDAGPPAETPEELSDAQGRAWPGQYLSKILPRVTRRSHYATFVSLGIVVPRTGERSVPVKVTAQADELPDDVDEAVEHLMIRVALPRK